MGYILIYLTSLVLGGAGAGIAALYGHKLGLLDHPNKRSSHNSPTPKGGGIGILAAFVSVSLYARIPPSFWIPGVFIGLLSLYGDKREFSPKLRLPLQVIAGIALFAGMNFHLNGIYGLLLVILLAVFAVGTANCYNFMDGINGIAAITGIVGFGLLAFSNIISAGDKASAVLCVSITVSIIGFLPFNMPKARVFMGDVGSVLLGFVFAGMVVMLSKSLLDYICLAGFLFPFYADELSTMAVRLRDGENLLRPHRRHLYQLLANEKGLSHWKVSTGFGLVQLIVGISLLLLKPFGIITIVTVLAAYFAAFVVGGVIVRRSVVSPDFIDS